MGPWEAYAGLLETRACTRRRSPGRRFRRRRAPRGRSGDDAMSASSMPWVVVAGVPTRMPRRRSAAAGSYGIAFLLSTMRAAPVRASASAPVTPIPAGPSRGEVGVGAAGDRAHALGLEDPAVSAFELAMTCGRRPGTPAARTRAAPTGLWPPAYDQRAAHHHREHGLVELRGVLLLAHEHAAALQDLVRGEGDDVGVGHRARDRLARHEADEVGGVDHEDAPTSSATSPEGREVDEARDRRAAADDHLRARCSREVAHLVVVDVPVCWLTP